MIRDFRTGEMVENWVVLRRLLERSGMKKSVFHQCLGDEFNVIYETPSQISEYMNPNSSRQIPSWCLLAFMTCLIKSTKERDYYVAEFIKERLPEDLHVFVSGTKKAITAQANKVRIKELEIRIARLEDQQLQNNATHASLWDVASKLTSTIDDDYDLIAVEYAETPGLKDFVDNCKYSAINELTPLIETYKDSSYGRSSIKWQSEFEPYAMEGLYERMGKELEAIYKDPEMFHFFKMFFIEGESLSFFLDDWAGSFEHSDLSGLRDIRDFVGMAYIQHIQQPFKVVAAFFESEKNVCRVSKLARMLDNYRIRYPNLYVHCSSFSGDEPRPAIRAAIRELIIRSNSYANGGQLSVPLPFMEFLKNVYPSPSNNVFDKVLISHLVQDRSRELKQLRVVTLGDPIKVALIEDLLDTSLADLYKSRMHDLIFESAAEYVYEQTHNGFDYCSVSEFISRAFDYMGPLPFSPCYINEKNHALSEYTKMPYLLDNKWFGGNVWQNQLKKE